MARYTIHDYAAKKQRQEMDLYKKYEQEQLASGFVKLPEDITQIYEFDDSEEIVWWSESQDNAWIVTEGIARGACKVRSLTVAELAEVNAYYVDDPICVSGR